jgi:hypothetical protein
MNILRFLCIILRVLRLEVPVYNVFVYHFCWGGGGVESSTRDDCE